MTAVKCYKRTYLAWHGWRWRPEIRVVKSWLCHPEMSNIYCRHINFKLNLMSLPQQVFKYSDRNVQARVLSQNGQHQSHKQLAAFFLNINGEHLPLTQTNLIHLSHSSGFANSYTLFNCLEELSTVKRCFGNSSNRISATLTRTSEHVSPNPNNGTCEP